MRIALVTPAPRGSRSGNRVTAVRWARILRQLGHRVQVTGDAPDAHVDLMIAIHAWRSAAAVASYRRRQPGAPLVVLLSGTDVYRFQHSHAHDTLATMRAAHRLVGLHDHVAHDIPSELAPRLRVIHQSCEPLARARDPVKRHFQVCVVGHLREEKDPLRAALAARLVPARSRLRVVQLGGAHDERWAAAARTEMSTNARYRWRGEVSPGAVRRCLGRSHAMVISSIMEGGANVVSEAMVADLPVIASDIAGNRGLLGDAHPAYFPARDEAALAQALWRAESEPASLAAVGAAGRARAHLFTPALELRRWRTLLDELRA